MSEIGLNTCNNGLFPFLGHPVQIQTNIHMSVPLLSEIDNPNIGIENLYCYNLTTKQTL